MCVNDGLSREDNLRLEIYKQICEEIRIGNVVAYAVVTLTYPTALVLVGWAFAELGGLWSGPTFAVSLVALLWLLLGSAIFEQIQYKAIVRINIGKRIEEKLKLKHIKARHLTHPGLDYSQKGGECWRKRRRFYIEGLSSVIRTYIPLVAIGGWIVYAVLSGFHRSGLKGATEFSDWLTSESVVFFFTCVIAAFLAGLGLRLSKLYRSKCNQGKRNEQTMK